MYTIIANLLWTLTTKDENTIRDMAIQLELDPASTIGQSYIRLLSEYASTNGIDSKQFLFGK